MILSLFISSCKTTFSLLLRVVIISDSSWSEMSSAQFRFLHFADNNSALIRELIAQWFWVWVYNDALRVWWQKDEFSEGW